MDTRARLLDLVLKKLAINCIHVSACNNKRNIEYTH